MKQRILQKISSLSFRDKVLFITITCLIVPAIGTFTFYNYLTKDAVKEQANISAKNELKLTDEYLKKVFEDMLYLLNFIQLDTELNNIFKSPRTDTNHLDNDSIYEEFQNEKKVQKTFDTITLKAQKVYITVLLNNGKVYTNYSSNEYNPNNLKNEPWFAKLYKLQGYRSTWIAPHPTMFASEKNKNPYSLSVARALQDSISGVYGYAIVTVTEDRIKEILKSENKDNSILLLNGANRMIGSEDRYQQMLLEQVNKIDSLQQANVINISGEKYLLNTREISITDWKLVSLIPYEKAVAKINSIFTKIFVIQTIAFIIFLFLLVYILRKILNRLVELQHLARKVQKGNLSVRSTLKGKDEIATLASSFNQMLDKVNEMIEENTLSQTRKRQAELAMLQAQINPHFLFNVLNSIRMKVMLKQDHESAEMISSLSKLLRLTIDKHKGMITFQEELEINQDYIRLMSMRHKHNIQLKLAVSAETLSIKIPRLVLQPIIENSIIHGFSDRDGVILINAGCLDDFFQIEIEDNGTGMANEQLNTVLEALIKADSEHNAASPQGKGFSSIGLSNVYERMKLTFGENFMLQVDSEIDKGTKVSMFIPIQKEDKHV